MGICSHSKRLRRIIKTAREWRSWCIASTSISFHIVSSIVWSTYSQSYLKFWTSFSCCGGCCCWFIFCLMIVSRLLSEYLHFTMERILSDTHTQPAQKLIHCGINYEILPFFWLPFKHNPRTMNSLEIHLFEFRRVCFVHWHHLIPA